MLIVMSSYITPTLLLRSSDIWNLYGAHQFWCPTSASHFELTLVSSSGLQTGSELITQHRFFPMALRPSEVSIYLLFFIFEICTMLHLPGWPSATCFSKMKNIKQITAHYYLWDSCIYFSFDAQLQIQSLICFFSSSGLQIGFEFSAQRFSTCDRPTQRSCHSWDCSLCMGLSCVRVLYSMG